ncbi:MAG: sulfite exporter TauE/SafE family protein, partial [Anaerolineaceae bacterium]|nr:sulfite exporter TauE/SafE family protein [Anaerolineaceae bacterium]
MTDNIYLFILVGLIAQMIDGSLGMAYGVSSNTFLLSIGLPPAAASASVHAAEVFTTGASGFFHIRFGNVRKSLFLKLVIPGVIGGALGAYILTSIPGNIIKPFVSAYLMVMGILILWKAFQPNHKEKVVTTLVSPLALFGGFLDAIGGGGWGPVVTTTLVARGNCPRSTIGSVNLAEFFVTLAVSITFMSTIGFEYLNVIAGLLI